MRIIKSVNRSAISPVLGMVLAFAIIVGAIGVVQQFFVPVWLKNAESMHYFEVKKEFEKLDEKIIEAADYGTSLLNINLDLEYPKYPFLLTPSKTTSTISIEKIGEIDSSLFSRKINLTAITLEPKYYQMGVNPETMILGEYFVNGSQIGGNQIFDGNKLDLIIYDGNNKTYSGNAELVFSGLDRFNGNGAPTWFNISVRDEYTWYIKYLEQLFKKYNVPYSNATDHKWINFTMNENNRIIIYYTITTLNDSSRIIKPTISGLKISNKTGMTELKESSGITIDLTSLGENPSLPTHYIVGNMTPNTNVQVNIKYTLYANNDAKGTYNQSFYWYSDSNGHFQLPITPPNRFEDHNMRGPESKEITKVVADIKFTIPGGETKEYTINFKLKGSGYGNGGCG